MLRFLPVLILFLVACNLSNAVKTPVPTSTPSVPTVTNIPLPGDLGLGNVTGTVTDAATGQPITNAIVTCQHSSYTVPEADRCNRTTATDANGVFLFEKVFFHDTDTITVTVEAPGYEKTAIKQSFFTWNKWKVDVALKSTQ